MTPKERRARIFKKDRPFIRPIQIYEDGRYAKDVGILWVAYQKKPFYGFEEGLTKEAFGKRVSGLKVLLADDRNRQFKEKGPVVMFRLDGDGWKICPDIYIFPWATKRNALRAMVAFLQYVRCSRKIGSCVIYSGESDMLIFKKCEAYGVLRYVGTIHGGRETGDEIIYSIKGKRGN